MRQAQLSSAGSFDVIEVKSASLGTVRRVTVWIPPGHRSRGRARVPVLYLNDGQNLFDPSRAFAGVPWDAAATAARLIRKRLIPPLIIAGIDHGEGRRAREYLPVEDDRNPFARKPLGREYARFVVRELMPLVERTYAAASGASNTGFGGSSYGAIAALYTTLLYPGLFGRLLLESPSLYVGRGSLLRYARAVDRWPARIYLAVGTAETRRADWKRETVRNVLELGAILRSSGLGSRRLLLRIDEGATHSEAAWAARFPEALTFLFGAR